MPLRGGDAAKSTGTHAHVALAHRILGLSRRIRAETDSYDHVGAPSGRKRAETNGNRMLGKALFNNKLPKSLISRRALARGSSEKDRGLAPRG